MKKLFLYMVIVSAFMFSGLTLANQPSLDPGYMDAQYASDLPAAVSPAAVADTTRWRPRANSDSYSLSVSNESMAAIASAVSRGGTIGIIRS